MKPKRIKAVKSFPRRREQKLRRQKEILEAAFKVFAAHGYEAARIDDVALQAGIAKGTIYLYFRDKERLFQAVVRNLIPKRFDALVKTLPEPPADLLRMLLSQLYMNVVGNEKVQSIVRMLVAEGGRFPQLAEIYHQEIIVPGMRAMRQALMKGIAEGSFRKSKALEFPQIIVAPALVAMLWQLLFAGRHPLDMGAYVKAHTEFVMRGLEDGDK
ncbi:MAG: TetR/AcrR family transcriptional regulator [Terriglobia bacterium]